MYSYICLSKLLTTLKFNIMEVLEIILGSVYGIVIDVISGF